MNIPKQEARDTSPIPSWQECADAGMSPAEAANARGMKLRSAYIAAQRHGLIFRDERKDPCNRERMRRRHADPEFIASHRRACRTPAYRAAIAARHRNPAFNPLAALTTEERADYDLLKRNKFTRNEALTAIGRQDLIR